MGVYIKGMEIPKSCADCALYRFGCTMEAKCWNMCAASGKDLDNLFDIGVPVWCPLVPVPEHGRLIDADILAAKCDDPYWCVWLSDIDDAPTIIEADKSDMDSFIRILKD